MTAQAFTAAPAAGRIVEARDPIIVLWMSGCETVLVNPAYKATFENDEFDVAGTPTEFDQLVTRFLDGKRSKQKARCFCEDRDLKAPISLTHRDCIHEVLWERLMRKFSDFRGLTLTSLPGIEFLREYPHKGGLERRYRVARVHARRLPEYAERAAELEGDFMEVRMLYAQSLVMPVRDDFSGPVPQIEAEVLFEKSRLPIVETTSFPVDRRKRPYLDVEALIDRALQQLDGEGLPKKLIADARATLDEGEQAIKHGFPDEYPIIHMLVEIVFDKQKVSGNVQLLRQRLLALKARLWDAPTVAWPMRVRIETFLEDRQAATRPDQSLRSFRDKLAVNEIGDLSALVEPLQMREGYDALL